MSNIIQIAYTTEGSTDKRFLGHIIERTYEALLFESDQNIEIYPPVHISEKASTFNETIGSIARKYSFFNVICVHCDADSTSPDIIMKRKIIPVFDLVEKSNDACRNLVAIVPVQMTEAWMLADIDLLLKEINTSLSCEKLNLPCKPKQVETIANPKIRIEEALRTAQSHVAKRRNRIKISDLYTPMAQKVSIQHLMELPSFKTFFENAKRSLINLNFLH